jgi:hypothetical protein
MNKLYTKDELSQIIAVLEDNVEDLGTWSVYNDDKYWAEIDRIRQAIGAIILARKSMEEDNA